MLFHELSKKRNFSNMAAWSFSWFLPVCCILSIIHFYFANQFTMKNAIDYQDTQIFVGAAIQWLKSGELYSLMEPMTRTYAPGAPVFKFPPIYILLYLPWLTLIESDMREFLYSSLYMVHILRYAIACLILSFIFGKDGALRRTLLLATLFCLSTPVLECLNGMTFENLLLLILAIIIPCLANNKRWLTAILFTFVALVKLYPAFIGVYFLSRKRIMMLPLLAVATTAWLILTVLLIGPDENINYYTRVMPVLLSEQARIGWINISLIHTLLAETSHIQIAMALVVFFTIALMNINPGNQQLNLLHYSLAILMPLLLLKNAWISYQIILMIPISILICSGLQQKGKMGYSKATLALLGFFPLLVSKNHPFLELPYWPYLESFIYFNPIHDLIHDLRIYSAALLWAGISLIILIESRQSQMTAKGNHLAG